MSEPKTLSPSAIVQEVDLFSPFNWVKQGWADMRRCLSQSLFYGLCFLAGGYLLLWVLRDSPEYYSAIVMGFFIVAPFLAMGLYDISRQLEAGEKPSLSRSMVVWRENTGQVAIFALILLVIYLVWARASMVAFALFYSGGLPTMQDFLSHLLKTDNFIFTFAFFCIGGFFAALAFVLSVVSIPMMMDKGTDTVTATLVSAFAVSSNVGPMIVWSGLIGLFALVNVGTLLFGVIIIGPLLGHATWHAYRDLIRDTQ